MSEAILTVTDAAARRLKQLIDKNDQTPIGMRLTVTERGCSGMSYSFDYAFEEQDGDKRVDADGVRVFIDPEVIDYIEGSEMDWQEDKFTAGFVFRNPNEKGRCGCGESFHI